MTTIIYESPSYAVRAGYVGGYLLVRRGHGAARYFKPGDAAKQFWSDLKGAEEADTPWIARTQIDQLLSRYDDKLDLEG